MYDNFQEIKVTKLHLPKTCNKVQIRIIRMFTSIVSNALLSSFCDILLSEISYSCSLVLDARGFSSMEGGRVDLIFSFFSLPRNVLNLSSCNKYCKQQDIPVDKPKKKNEYTATNDKNNMEQYNIYNM